MSTPPEPSPDSGSALQFDKAEYGGSPGEATACTGCQRPMSGAYYQVNGTVVCEACKDACVAALTGPLPKALLGRAALLGAGAAALGSIAWFAVAKLTGYELGILAVVVGVFVGRAVRRGSGGRGGRGLQILAVVLTYFSIVTSYVPDVVKAMLQAPAAQAAANPAGGSGGTAGASATPAAHAPATAAAPQPASAPAAPAQQPDPRTGAASPAADAGPHPLVAIAMILGLALGIAFIAPFLAGFQNILGILIIGFALWEAWRVNRRLPVNVEGPFQLGGAAVPKP